MSGEEKSLQNRTPNGVVVEQRSFHSGPLPAPETLEKYERILPGLADRIVTMAEAQSAHRQKLESRVVWFDGSRTMLGLLFGFGIALGGIVAGTFLILGGHNIAGLASILTPLGVIVLAFIYQNSREDEGED